MSSIVSARAYNKATDAKIYKSRLAWALLLALLFYCSGGDFSFESKAGLNSSDVDRIQVSQSSADPVQRAIEAILFLPPIVLLLFIERNRLLNAFSYSKETVLVLAWAVMSALWSQQQSTSLLSALDLVVGAAFAIALFTRFGVTRLMHLFVFLGSIFLALNLAFIFLLPQFGTRPHAPIDTWQGICGHKNVCAYTAVFLLSPVFYLRLRTSLQGLLRAFYTLGMTILILGTQSRTGWLLLACLIVFTFGFKLLERYAARDKMILSTLATSLLVAAGIGTWTYLPFFTEAVGKDATLNGRTAIWFAVLDSIEKRPLLGYGFHAFWTGFDGESARVIATVLWNPAFAHNGYLELCVELGIIGVALVVAMIAIALVNGMRCMAKGSKPWLGWYLSVIFLTVVLNIDESSFLGTRAVTWLIFVICCLGLSIDAKSKAVVAFRAHRMKIPSVNEELVALDGYGSAPFVRGGQQ